jgi:uncharacterized protein DUF4407
VRMRRWLARLAGAQEDILCDAKGDLVKHTAMGGVLISTAAVAGVSAAFALSVTVRLPALASVVVGAIWALIIVNLDRMLVVSMGRQAGVWRNVLTALPRIALAVVIGAVISTPLVLRIFQPEIDNELQVMHSENLIENQKKLDARFADLPALAARVDELVGVASGRTQPGVNDAPDVTAARADVAAKEQVYRTDADNAQCELVGSCGTHVPGANGQAYREAKARADESQRQLDAARSRLREAEQAARSRISGAVIASRSAAQQDLDRLQPTLRERQAARSQAQRELDAGEANNTGLLARLEALDRLSADRPLLRTAHRALFLLFLLIEVLPVLVKFLSGFGPLSLYEQLVQRREKEINQGDAARAGPRTAIADLHCDVVQQLEQDRAAKRIKLGKAANAALFAKQTEITLKAIDVWGQVASARNDEQLARWFHQHQADQSLSTLGAPSATGPVATSPSPNGHRTAATPAAPHQQVGNPTPPPNSATPSNP